jgi:hypothetical protein
MCDEEIKINANVYDLQLIPILPHNFLHRSPLYIYDIFNFSENTRKKKLFKMNIVRIL